MKMNEGFESRIAIGDLEPEVQEKIFKRLFPKGGHDQLKSSLEDVFYDIDTFEVEIDSRGIGELADAMKEDVEVLAKEIQKILKLLPKSEVGQYENENNKPTRRIKMFEEFTEDYLEELEGHFFEDDDDDEEDEDGDEKYSSVDDIPRGGMEIEGEIEAIEEEDEEDLS